ncbi:MAG: c-type cytochrome, partial [Bacteroidota bacterium]
QYYLHELNLAGVRSEDGQPLLHPMAYYTLNNIAEGDRVPASEISVKKAATPAPKPAAAAPKVSSAVPTYSEIEPLLVKNTCTACHNVSKRQVGPAFADIAKRNYSPEKIVDLIYNPQPKNWPEYATPMAALPQVPKGEARRIALWINSLVAAKP